MEGISGMRQTFSVSGHREKAPWKKDLFRNCPIQVFSASASQHSAVDSGGGIFDDNGTDGFFVEIHGSRASDDAVAVAFFIHSVEAGEKKRTSDALTPLVFRNTRGT